MVNAKDRHSNDSLESLFSDQAEQLLESNSDSLYTPPNVSKESWNNPLRNIFKVWTICYGFIVFGMNDASIGAIVHKLEDHYKISYAIVSLAFLFSFTGYLISAICAEHVHQKIGRWGVSCVAVSCQIVCYLIASTAPPYFLFIAGYAISGFGNGLLEASWNAFAGNLNNENEILGLLHGSYGLGGILAPTIETMLIARGYKWNSFYYVISFAAIISLLNSVFFFQDETAEHYRLSLEIDHNTKPTIAENEYELGQVNGEYEQLNNGSTNNPVNQPAASPLSQVIRSQVIWLFSIVLFFYVGTEVTLGGWVTTFMIKIRNGDPERMGYVATGFWVGITLGRIVLGFVGGKIKREQFMTTVYMLLSILSFSFFWLIPNLVVSAISISLAGFFMGPLFPTIMIVFMQKTPKKLQVLGIGFSTAFGGIGAALMPFADGLLSSYIGPKVLGPFGFIMLVLMASFWSILVYFF